MNDGAIGAAQASPSKLVARTTERLTWPGADERRAILEGPVTPDAFRESFATLAALHALEVVPPIRPTAPGATLSVAFWNAERLKYHEPSVALMRSLAADVLLLSEVDVGMARSGNRHTVAELARGLEAGYLFGTEFVELDLGDARERGWHRGEANAAGLHGAAIVTGLALARPALIRLEASGRWFDGAFGERRVGGRMALAAEIAVGGKTVLVVSAHYESHTDPEDRLVTTRVMLDAIDAHAPGRPVLIGGDFNTSTFTLAEKRDPEVQRTSLLRDPKRFVDPVAYEPMFAELASRGYDWRSCNLAQAPTQRTRPDGTPPPPFGKIDWLFARGLDCSEPTIIAAVDGNGVAISDHEVLAVTVAPK